MLFILFTHISSWFLLREIIILWHFVLIYSIVAFKLPNTLC